MTNFLLYVVFFYIVLEKYLRITSSKIDTSLESIILIGIAAIKVGSKLPVTFNDIDSDALEAVALNCQDNGVPSTDYLLDKTNLLEGDLEK